MPRPHNKEDLLKAALENYESLMSLIDGLSEKELSTPFDFSNQPSKKEAHWGRDKNVRDVLIHLYEWHQLMIQFVHNFCWNVTGLSGLDQLCHVSPFRREYGRGRFIFLRGRRNCALRRRLTTISFASLTNTIRN